MGDPGSVEWGGCEQMMTKSSLQILRVAVLALGHVLTSAATVSALPRAGDVEMSVRDPVETLAGGCLRDQTSQDPEAARAAYRRASAYAKAGLEAEALGYESFVWPLEGDPDFAPVRGGVALREVVLGAAKERRRELIASARSNPEAAGSCLVEAARLWELEGDPNHAIELLELGLARGYRDFRELEKGGSFARLRRHPRFAAVVDDAFRAAFAWSGTDQQKIAGLMRVYSEVTYSFVFFDRCPDLDWEAEVLATIPKALSARSMEDYYRTLAELVARLGDGHTNITYPRSITAEYDRVPLDLEPVQGRFVVTRIGAAASLRRAGVLRGDTLLAIDDVPTPEALETRVLRYQSFSTGQAALAYGASHLLVGPEGAPVRLLLERPDGRSFVASLRYVSRQPDGSNFGSSKGPPVRSTEVRPGIHWIELDSFESAETSRAFVEELRRLDLAAVRGLILDVRRNSGGNSAVGWDVISHLVDEPMETSAWKTRMHVAAHRAWGRQPEWFQGTAPVIQPARDLRYLGPGVVLTSAFTYSAAEDFCVPLKHAGRAVLVGASTGGSTGQPLKVYLPGGGSLRVCSKRDSFPDGTEFVGVGIEPDVKVERTVDDVAQGIDPVLDRAIQLLENRVSGEPDSPR